MKKILMLFAAAALMFAACNPKEQPKDPSKDPSKDAPVSADPSVDPGKTEDKLSVDLTRRNFDIAGDFDYDIAIDGKTATIQLAYADKDEAQALDIEFIGLPSGVEADYTNPYDYSDGKTQEIVFKKAGSTDESKWDKWTVGVDVAAEIPHFVELSVAGVEITSAEQTIKMAGGTDLSKLVVEYVVSPEGSVVKADGVAIASGAEVDFSDMLNGNWEKDNQTLSNLINTVYYMLQNDEINKKILAEMNGREEIEVNYRIGDKVDKTGLPTVDAALKEIFKDQTFSLVSRYYMQMNVTIYIVEENGRAQIYYNLY